MEPLDTKKLLAEIYESEELKICMKQIHPADIRDDVKHHVFVILMGLPSTFIIELYQRLKLKRYVVKCLLNAVRMDRSSWNYGKPKENYSDQMDLFEICTSEYNELTLDLSWLYWYDLKILELYTEHGTYRKVAELTKIPMSSIYDTITKVREKVKFKMSADEFLDDKHYFYHRVINGVDAHLSEKEGAMFERLAKLISPHQEFPWKGCQECANHLVKFVYNNRKRIDYGSG